MRLLKRALWSGGCAAMMLVALGVGVDRTAVSSVSYADKVPGWLRNFSLASLAWRAVEDGDTEQATAYARQNLARNPVPAENLSAMATTLIEQKEYEAASQWLVAASGRGWRDPATQVFVAEVAMSNQQPDMAVARFRALLAVGGRQEESLRVAQTILADDEGVKSMASWLREDPQGSETFFSWGMNNLPVEALTSLASMMAPRKLGCTTVDRLASNALGRGYADAAWKVWSAPCKGERQLQAAYDLAFGAGGAGDGQTPYDWRLSFAPGLTYEWSGSGQGATIHYRNRRAGASSIGVKNGRLRPGTHILRYTGDLSMSAPPRVQISCLSSDGTPGWRLRQVTLSVQGEKIEIPSDCTTQRFNLFLAQGVGRNFALQVE